MNTTNLRNATKKTLTTTLALALISLLAAASTATAQNHVEGRLLIKMNGNANARSGLPGVTGLRSLGATTGARSADQAEWFVAELDANETVESAMENLANFPGVEAVEPDNIVSIPTPVANSVDAMTISDPSSSNQYALARIQAEQAWQINGGSKQIVVAVIDSGVQYDHPDLENQIWFNNAETQNGIDDDGNGFVDDIAGWNFVSNNNDPYDDNEHGTHCAGIVAATRNNNTGIAGAADVSIMMLKVLDAQGSGADSDIIAAIRYAMNNGANVISMSLGGGAPSQAVEQVCNEAVSRNIVVVAATGNDGQDNSISFPAGYQSVIAVGATDANDRLADFSNAGPGMEISAPGADILSTVPGSTYGTLSGTSMATPYVAAVAALVKSANPSMSASAIRDRLNGSADDLGNPGYDTFFGHGRLNAFRALNGQGGTPAPTPNNPGTPNNGDDQFEDNDTPETAATITAGSFNLTCNDEDWFVLETTGYFAVQIQGNGGDLDLIAYDSDGTELDFSESETSNEFVEGFSSTGLVAILVLPYEGQTAGYTMTVALDDSTNQPIIPDIPGFPGDDFDPGFDFGPGDGTIVVPVTCGAGAVQMFAGLMAGLVGMSGAVRSRRRRNRA